MLMIPADGGSGGSGGGGVLPEPVSPNPIPAPTEQPIQSSPLLYIIQLAPYVLQAIALLLGGVYIILRDGDASQAVISALVSVILGTNVVQTFQGVTHSITNASVQRKAIGAGEHVATHEAST